MGYRFVHIRPSARLCIGLGAILLGSALLAPARASAQQAVPLSKSDVVRLLAEPTYSPAEVTAIVRRSCLSFKPTSDDMDDFHRLGATDATLAAIRECAARGLRRASPQKAPATPVVHLEQDTLTARVGEVTRFTARVERGGKPASGLTLVVEGSGQIPGGAGSDIAGTTGASGIAAFRMPAGRTPGQYPLAVRVAGQGSTGAAMLVLKVVAGTAARVTVRPDTLQVGTGTRDTTMVLVAVRDTFGNLVQGAPVTLTLPRPGASARTWSDTSDASGSVTLHLPTGALRSGERLSVSVRGRSLAVLPVAGPGGTVGPGPLSPDSVAALRDRAARLLSAGRSDEAADLYGRILAVRPNDPDALLGRGRALAAGGQLAEAESTLAKAVKSDATNVAARRELARVELQEKRPAAAIASLQDAVAMAPGDAASWTVLGDAYMATGQARSARDAYERALAAEPGQAEASRGLERARRALVPRPPYAKATVWGGYTNNNGRSFGPRRVELDLWTSANVDLYGRYDDALNFDHPELVRGNVDVQSFWGGAAVTYGSSDRLTTQAEVGRRKLPPAMTVQTMWSLKQTVWIGPAGDPFLRPSVHVSGLLGHWYDLNDWVAEAGAGIPLGRYFRLEPRVSYGDLVGSVPSNLRIQAKDARFGLGGWIRPAPGWRIEPMLAYGHVSSPPSDPALGGDLFDASLRVTVPMGSAAGLDLFVRYQSPPGLSHFTQMGVGLTGLVPRP